MDLTIEAEQRDGIWFPKQGSQDERASLVWSEAAAADPIHAAAASTDPDPFSKYPEWIREHFDPVAGTMLDAGCGYGRVSIPLLKANPRLRCIGVDAAPVMLLKYQQLAIEHGVRDRVELYCGNVDTLPFPSDHFAAALSCAVLLHLPKADVKSILREFRRVLCPGGKLVLASSFPNLWNPEAFANIGNNFHKTANGPVRAYTRGEVIALLRDFSSAEVSAHQLIVLPRSMGTFPLPFAAWSRKANAYASRAWMPIFRHSRILVNHHDVTVIK